jgi:hypothetical protein
MGRGLSELQKSMLMMSMKELENYNTLRNWVLAAGKTFTDSECSWMAPYFHGEVAFSEVFTKIYGWKPGPDGHFSKKDIGLKRYMAAKIAVRKAAERLVKRGLIFISGKYYFITTEGEAILSAKLYE